MEMMKILLAIDYGEIVMNVFETLKQYSRNTDIDQRPYTEKRSHITIAVHQNSNQK